MSPFRHGISAIAATTCALLGVGPESDRQGPPPASLGVRTITSDFRAVSADGSPIVDLTAADVTVTVAGQRRPVRSIELVRDVADVLGAADGSDPRAPLSPALPAPFATNARAGRGRTFYLLVDEASLTPGDFNLLESAIDDFLVNLAPDDEVALATVQPGGAHEPPTTDRAGVRGALTGLKSPGSTDERPASANTRSAACLLRLGQLLGALRGVEQPPVVVAISTGLSVPPSVKDAGTRGAGSRQTAAGRGERGRVMPPDVGQIRLAAAQARAELYFVQLPGQRPGVTPSSSADRSTDTGRQAAQQVVAADVGGDVLRLRPSDNAFLRVARETSSHYVVSVDASDDLRLGVAYPITIATGRLGVVLRLRPDAFSGGPTALISRPPTTAQMLGDDEFRQLPIRLAGFTTRAGSREGASVIVTCLTEPVDSRVRFRSATAVLLNAAGTRVAEETAGATALAGTPVVSTLLAPPGHYVLRVAVVDAEGRAGSADCPIDAVLTSAGRLTLSSLRVGVAQPPAPPGLTRGDSTSGPDPRVAFTSETAALAFFDLYGGTPNEHVTLLMDVLKKADGPPVQQLEPRILPARASEPGHYIVTAPVDLADLPPGDYLIRATVGITGQASVEITRTLRKMKAGATR
jgi:hypothetical protein